MLIDFLLTVKAATLILISGRGLAISSAKQGNQVLFIIWRRTDKFLSRANMDAFYENPNPIHTVLTFTDQY